VATGYSWDWLAKPTMAVQSGSLSLLHEARSATPAIVTYPALVRSYPRLQLSHTYAYLATPCPSKTNAARDGDFFPGLTFAFGESLRSFRLVDSDES
jgi:hypothetical protein